MPDAFHVVMLPGMGADARLLEPQRKAFPEMYVPPWIPPACGETLPEYATRLAATIPQRPLVLGGVSLGGMLAYEMARHLQPSAVVLVASCRSSRRLRTLLRAGRWLAPWVPCAAVRGVQWLTPPLAAMLLSLPQETKRLCVTMFRDADAEFVRWALQAIAAWDPPSLEGIPVRHIHGDNDWLIRPDDADERIRDGSHLINLSHADAVNRFLQKVVEQSISITKS